MKKILSVIFAFLLLVGVFGFTSPYTGANDKKVYAETILERSEIPIDTGADAMAHLGILKGTEKGYELERDVTRAEAVVFISRIMPYAIGDDISETPFEDVKGHWAEEIIGKFYKCGYIHGTSEKSFSPQKSVTGKEFTKMLLSVMGYDDITIENAYEKGVEAEIISNNFTKSVVYGNMTLIRSDVTRLCHSTLTAKCADGERLDKKLIDKGIYNREDFEGVLYGKTPVAMNFSDRLNKLMPDDKNYMFSPLSIKMALMLAANGAEGETLDALLKISDTDNIDLYNEYAKNLTEQYENAKVLKLSVANSIWLNKDVSTKNFSDSYREKVSEFYGAQANEVSKSDAVKKINDWVFSKTNGKISEIISSPDFWAALVNAVYFKGNWKDEFSESATYEGDFTNKDESTSKAEYMLREGKYNVFRDDSSVIVEIPFSSLVNDEQGNVIRDDIAISMYAIMSDSDYKSQLVSRCIKENKFTSKKAQIHIPKFRIEYSAVINDMLKEMGMERAFDKYNAQFEKMFDKKDEFNMYIDQVLHKTYIDVDEKGCEAAAVTAVMMAGASSAPKPEEPEIIKFDKPFTFIIYDKTNCEVLFMGEHAFATKTN